MSDTSTPSRQQLLGLTFDQLFTARTIAAAGSFREASKILCLTQPAISQRVQHIESIIGAPIFDRHAGIGVTVTRAGRTFLSFCDDALGDLDALAARMSAAGESDSESVLSITAPSDSIQHFILQTLPEYRARYPRRTVRLTQSGSRAETIRAMTSGEADLAFYRMPAEPALDTVAMMDEHLYLVATPDHAIFSTPEAERASAIGRFSFATFSIDMRSRQLVERWALKAGVRLRIDLQSKSLDVLRESAIHGALSILPGVAVTEALCDGRLAVVAASGLPLPRATAVGVLAGAEPSQSVHDFVELLVERCQDRPDETMPDIRLASNPRTQSRDELFAGA